jgi:hypothetical protein
LAARASAAALLGVPRRKPSSSASAPVSSHCCIFGKTAQRRFIEPRGRRHRCGKHPKSNQRYDVRDIVGIER